MVKRRILTLVLLGSPYVVAAPLAAQTTATISGTVTDDTGGVLPTADITVTNMQTGTTRTAVADASGRYRVTNLPIGEYEVTASISGFGPATRRGISLTIGREAVVDLKLRVGDLTENLTVTGDAPLVDARSGGMSGIVDRDTILEIPLQGRDLTGLIGMQPGTIEVGSATASPQAGFGRRFSIGGARPSDNAVLLDGTDVKSQDQNVPAGVTGNFLGGEAIQEFKIERNAYSAQYGGGSGGVINVVSKAGTNDFHGSGYGFFRNDALDATNFRAPDKRDESGRVIGKEKPDFARQQFGASAGGRILRNKTFYFANYEGLREELGFTGFLRTLTPQARLGILPGRTVQVNPGVIPYLDLWPLPGPTAADLGDGTAREPVILTIPTQEDFFQLRVDHNFSNSNALYGRITRQVSDRTNPGPGTIGGGPSAMTRWHHVDRVYNTFLTVEETKIFTANLLNTFRFGFNRRGIAQDSFEDPPVDPALFMVPPDIWKGAGVPIMGGLSVSGLDTVGVTRPGLDRRTTNLQFSTDVAYNRGAHSLKLGINWKHARMSGYSLTGPGGEAGFDSIDDFLRGWPSYFRGDVLPGTDPFRNIRWNIIGTYVQDDWRVHDRLTVNLGLRHEFYTTPTERDGKYANLKDPLNDKEITALGTRGDPWWKNNSLKSFAPRLGFAWDPTGSDKMAVRGGAGVFYNHVTGEYFGQAAWNTAPFALESFPRVVPGQMPFPDIYPYIVGLGVRGAAMHLFPYENFDNQRMVQWNVNIQREVLPQTAVTIGYAGSRGLDLMRMTNLNTGRAQIIDGRYVFPVGTTRPNPAFNVNLDTRENTSNSWYHSLQIELQRRFQSGWMLQAAYTRSKAIDEGSQVQTLYNGQSRYSMYYWEPRLDRGLATFHVLNRFSATGVWVLPFGAGQRFGSSWTGLTEGLLGGWQLGGQVVLSDGGPAGTISMGTPGVLSALGVSGQRPDLVPGGDLNPVIGDPDGYFDVSHFTVPPPRTLGNVGRNTLIGPGLVTVDLGITKNTQLTSRLKMQLRLEVFNLLNRANFGSPSTSVFNAAGRPNGNAGFIDETSTPARQIQLGTRFEW